MMLEEFEEDSFTLLSDGDPGSHLIHQYPGQQLPVRLLPCDCENTPTHNGITPAPNRAGPAPASQPKQPLHLPPPPPAHDTVSWSCHILLPIPGASSHISPEM